MAHLQAAGPGDRPTQQQQQQQPPQDRQPKSADQQDIGQVHHVIGDFGKYQLLIYVFKVLIGVTSAFNNLGVTFYAPSDFIGHSCAQVSPAGPLSASRNVAAAALPLNISSAWEHLHRHNNASHYLRSIQASHRDPELTRVFADFIYNEERDFRHLTQQPKAYDTPEKSSLVKECHTLDPQTGKRQKCTRFEYNTGIWISTIIDEWDLVCDRSWFVSMSQSLYMSGFLFSFLVFGYISDRFGRWNSLLVGASLEVACGFGCALSHSVYWFMFFRFFLGFGNAGRTTSSYLVMIEWTGPKWRKYISTLGSLGWVMGYCSMPWISRYFLHFRHMQLFTCFYEIIFIIWLLRIPESPRWLLTHNRFDKAREVLLMAAKFNGLIVDKTCNATKTSKKASLYGNHQLIQKVPASTVTPNSSSASFNSLAKLNLPDPIKSPDLEASNDSCCRASSREQTLEPYTLDEFEVKFEQLCRSIDSKAFSGNESNLNVLTLFKWPNLRRYLMFICFVWAANSFIYYGIVLRIGDFGGKNLFVAFTIAGLTELPSMVFTMIFMKYLPRKTSNIFICSICGMLCALQVPLQHYDIVWLQLVTMLMAKVFNTCAFCSILYQTMELFPTTIRQTAYSWCALAGRIGSILAPFIKELAQMTNRSVPPIIYAGLSIISVLFICNVPETKGVDLPDTLIEAENFKGSSRKSYKKIKSMGQ